MFRWKLPYCVVFAAAFAPLAPAHHSVSGQFDTSKSFQITGVVSRVEWVNPHTWIHITVPDTDGKGKAKKGTTYNWAIEGGTPNTLLRTGIKKDSLKVGTEVVVRGYQSKDALCDVHPKTKKKTCKANGRDVTFPNGCKLFVGSSGTGAPKDGSDATEDKSASANTCNAATPA